jgi:glycosyltransferase involved in cell wall biosynthesis
MKKITIIIPAYNEEEALPYLFERLKNITTESPNYEYEILFINDAATVMISPILFSKYISRKISKNCVFESPTGSPRSN